MQKIGIVLTALACLTLGSASVARGQTPCLGDPDCTTPGEVCVAGFCQPATTTTTTVVVSTSTTVATTSTIVVTTSTIIVTTTTVTTTLPPATTTTTTLANCSLLNCNDNNACTNDTCTALGGCAHTNRANGTACGDSNMCNGVETCQGGVCTPGSGGSCDDGNICSADSCDPIQGCKHVPVICDDGNPCTRDTCDSLIGCHSVALANGTPCTDQNVCNGVETCQSGTCTPGSALHCSQNLFGNSLLLRVNNFNQSLFGLKVKTRGTISFARASSNGSAGDPTLYGASVRLLTSGDHAEDFTYVLPAARWQVVGKANANKGYRYRDLDEQVGPIRSVVVMNAGNVEITGVGHQLNFSLMANPNPVAVVLTLGSEAYCLSFGGDTTFTTNARFRARSAPAPTCTP
jgi:hypothetical protein